jgi:alpha-amylase/alpha-mannosidase (GH57 family)
MPKVRLAFLWHMHQPLYRQPETDEYLMPWVRLHATRAYYDMAWMLERHPGIRCTVNFTPVLLDQLEDYARGVARDRFLDLSIRPAAHLYDEERQSVLRSFFMVDWETVVRAIPRYWELLQKRGRDLRFVDLPAVAKRFSDAEITDLQVLFNLGWMGFGALEDDRGLLELRRKGRDFTQEDLAYILAAQRRIVGQIVPRWRALSDKGQVELSTTPYFHPILPLVCDTDAARRALPGLQLPPRFSYPQDARWHVRQAIESHARRFGRPPAGMWPAEGSVSPEALEVLASEGVRWACSDEGVLLHSLPADAPRLSSLYRPWTAAAGAGEVAMLFRDRGLSDLIGFTYSKIPAAAAVSDFLFNLETIGRAWDSAHLEGQPTVGVFLDGENPWEHFAGSGREFLDTFYGQLESSSAVETVTLSEAVADTAGRRIDRIHSGSWIEASYRIWIGHEEDRLAWTALGKAREAVEAATRDGTVSAEVLELARQHIHAAEGSDWFWWYGEDFSTELAAEFDGLFRGHVIRACRLLGAAPPREAVKPIKQLDHPGIEAKPLREPTLLVSPTLDGRETSFFEWQGAGLYRPGQHRGSMFGGAQAFHVLHYAFDLVSLYLRLDPAETTARTMEVANRVSVTVLGPNQELRIDFPLAEDGKERRGAGAGGVPLGRAVFLQIFEAALPFAEIGLRPRDAAAVFLQIWRGDVEVERLPRSGFVNLTVPDQDFERIHWRV